MVDRQKQLVVNKPKQVSRLKKLSSLFESRSWRTNGEFIDKMETAFARSMELALTLTDNEYAVFVQLLENYEFLNYEKQIAALRRMLRKTSFPPGIRKFNIAPVIAPEDKGKDKSGSSLVYHFKANVWEVDAKYDDIELHSYSDAEWIQNKDESVSIFIDDFSGTGQTVEEFYYDYLARKKDSEHVYFFIIAVMQSAVDRISHFNATLVYDYLAPRAVGDSPINQRKAYAAIDSIEADLEISPKFKYGYEQSEAIITMTKTPNNTLPMFWRTVASDGGKWPAPFPRKKP